MPLISLAHRKRSYPNHQHKPPYHVTDPCMVNSNRSTVNSRHCIHDHLRKVLDHVDDTGADLAQAAEDFPSEQMVDTLASIFKGQSVALVHEWISAPPAGSERVFEAILRLFINVDHDILTLYSDHTSGHEIEPRIQTSFLSSPLLSRLNREHQLPLMPLAWAKVGAKSYDTAIVSSHAMANRVAARATQSLVYAHTPMRYAWLPDVDSRSTGLLAAVRPLLRHLDRRAARNVTTFVANSTEVGARIERFYRRTASVVFPPVDTSFFTPRHHFQPPIEHDTPFLVTAGRLVSYKRHDMAIRLAGHVGIPIVVVGDGPERSKLERLAESLRIDAVFHPGLNDRELREVLRCARALVHLGHEDFGILPVQALACGTPILTCSSGGALDYLSPGAGVGVGQTNLISAARSLDRLLTDRLDPHSISQTAEQFSYRKFYERMLRALLSFADRPQRMIDLRSKSGSLAVEHHTHEFPANLERYHASRD